MGISIIYLAYIEERMFFRFTLGPSIIMRHFTSLLLLIIISLGAYTTTDASAMVDPFKWMKNSKHHGRTAPCSIVRREFIIQLERGTKAKFTVRLEMYIRWSIGHWFGEPVKFAQFAWRPILTTYTIKNADESSKAKFFIPKSIIRKVRIYGVTLVGNFYSNGKSVGVTFDPGIPKAPFIGNRYGRPSSSASFSWSIWQIPYWKMLFHIAKSLRLQRGLIRARYLSKRSAKHIYKNSNKIQFSSALQTQSCMKIAELGWDVSSIKKWIINKYDTERKMTLVQQSLKKMLSNLKSNSNAMLGRLTWRISQITKSKIPTKAKLKKLKNLLRNIQTRRLPKMFVNQRKVRSYIAKKRRIKNEHNRLTRRLKFYRRINLKKIARESTLQKKWTNKKRRVLLRSRRRIEGKLNRSKRLAEKLKRLVNKCKQFDYNKKLKRKYYQELMNSCGIVPREKCPEYKPDPNADPGSSYIVIPTPCGPKAVRKYRRCKTNLERKISRLRRKLSGPYSKCQKDLKKVRDKLGTATQK